ncbi:MAG: hypothetical protein OXH68_04610 [Gammaproteobacteria bacterium]|nr:hypothetical protein [Gammaproteobacteria bacterium]
MRDRLTNVGADTVTERLDAVYADDKADSRLDEGLQALQYALLKQVETWPVLGVEPVAPAETKPTPVDR